MEFIDEEKKLTKQIPLGFQFKMKEQGENLEIPKNPLKFKMADFKCFLTTKGLERGYIRKLGKIRS